MNSSANVAEAATRVQSPHLAKDTTARARIASVDALRGFVMFMMIFVNDLAGAGRVVPDWMVHFSERHQTGSGMTFVDLVFPAFLFIVGMSIPLSLGARVERGEPSWKLLGHIIFRTISLMFIGILMVHGTPDRTALGWSGDWWCVMMYVSAIAAFASLSPKSFALQSRTRIWRATNFCVRLAGLAMLVWLAFAFRGPKGERIITLTPLSLATQWYGILGLIGWAYLVACVVYLVFRGHRTAILGSAVLLLCLFAADRQGLFDGFWLSKVVGIGGTLGSLPAIAVSGLLLGSILKADDTTSLTVRARFTFWFVAGCAAGALLLDRVYGISKNSATPSWCLWSCAISASLWFVAYLISDVRPVNFIARPLAITGQNVFLAYLISDLLPSLLGALHLMDDYSRLAGSLSTAIARSTICGVLILLASAGLNRIGFRLRL